MLDVFIGEHLAHVRTAGRVTNSARAAAYEADGTVAGTLHMSHCHKGNKMSCMEAVSGRVKTNIERHALLIEKFPQFCFIGALGDKAAFL
jgi:hypothetical protein